jgi:ribosome recycling factor
MPLQILHKIDHLFHYPFIEFKNMISDIKKTADDKMQKSLDAFKNKLAKVRTGRAHSGLLDSVMVDYYGSDVQIGQVANVGLADSRTLLVQPFEKSMAGKIEKAIRDSDLGLNPSSVGESIRVPMPMLTEERRKDLIKVVRSEAEEARVSIRNVRRDANNDFKKGLKDKTLTEDDIKRGENETQKLTDKYILELDKLLADKEKELLSV